MQIFRANCSLFSIGANDAVNPGFLDYAERRDASVRLPAIHRCHVATNALYRWLHCFRMTGGVAFRALSASSGLPSVGMPILEEYNPAKKQNNNNGGRPQ